MSTVYLIHGFLGAGKTTLATLIGGYAPAVRLSADEWYIALFGQDGQLGIDSDAEKRMRALLWDHWPSIVSAGADVVLDMGFWTRADRDRARAVCRALEVQLITIHVITDHDTAIARCAQRNHLPTGAFHIDDKTYYALLRGFEPLEPDESRITFRT